MMPEQQTSPTVQSLQMNPVPSGRVQLLIAKTKVVSILAGTEVQAASQEQTVFM